MSRLKRKQVPVAKRHKHSQDEALITVSKVQQQPPTALFDMKYTPHTIMHRDREMRQLQQFIESPKSEQANFMMVTGLPGSGKTLSVNKVLDEWEGSIRSVRVNAMTVKSWTEFLATVTSSLQLEPTMKALVEGVRESDRQMYPFKVHSCRILMIDEFESLFAKGNEAFTLMPLSERVDLPLKVIGLSNDTEWLQQQTRRLKVVLPPLQHIVFEPYTYDQVQGIVRQRMLETLDFATHACTMEEDALRFCAGQVTSSHGGDLRMVLDVCKRILSHGVLLITKTDVTRVTGVQQQRTTDLVDMMSFEQQLILMALRLIQRKDPNILEIELPAIITKLNWMKTCLGLESGGSVEESISLLGDYNFISIRTRAKTTKVAVKADLAQVERILAQRETFKAIFANL